MAKKMMLNIFFGYKHHSMRFKKGSEIFAEAAEKKKTGPTLGLFLPWLPFSK